MLGASGPAPPDLGSSGRDRSPLIPLGMSRSTRADVGATFANAFKSQNFQERRLSNLET